MAKPKHKTTKQGNQRARLSGLDRVDRDLDAAKLEKLEEAARKLLFDTDGVIEAIDSAATHALGSSSIPDTHAALTSFVELIGANLAKRKRYLSIEYLLFGTGTRPERAREDLERVHDKWFDRFVAGANATGGELATRKLEGRVRLGVRDMALDGLRAYLLACRSEPRGEAATRAGKWYAASLADLASSRMARAFPAEIDALEDALATSIQSARIPFTPFRLSGALRFAHRVMFAGLA